MPFYRKIAPEERSSPKRKSSMEKSREIEDTPHGLEDFEVS
jgi:soluble cytochrome b562